MFGTTFFVAQGSETPDMFKGYINKLDVCWTVVLHVVYVSGFA